MPWKADTSHFINFINFNQDFSSISVGTQNGYKVFTLDPFNKCFSDSMKQASHFWLRRRVTILSYPCKICVR